MGLTGYIFPGNAPSIRLAITVRPTLRFRSVAPITATTLGEKIESSGRSCVRRISWAVSPEFSAECWPIGKSKGCVRDVFVFEGFKAALFIAITCPRRT